MISFKPENNSDIDQLLRSQHNNELQRNKNTLGELDG